MLIGACNSMLCPIWGFRQKQAVNRDVVDVTSAFKQGIFYALLLALTMISAVALAVRIHEARWSLSA